MKEELKYYQSYITYLGNEGSKASQAIYRGLHTPRTQHHLQKTSHQLFLLSSNYNKR
jgi:hypothetical protein